MRNYAAQHTQKKIRSDIQIEDTEAERKTGEKKRLFLLEERERDYRMQLTVEIERKKKEKKMEN